MKKKKNPKVAGKPNKERVSFAEEIVIDTLSDADARKLSPEKRQNINRILNNQRNSTNKLVAAHRKTTIGATPTSAYDLIWNVFFIPRRTIFGFDADAYRVITPILENYTLFGLNDDEKDDLALYYNRQNALVVVIANGNATATTRQNLVNACKAFLKVIRYIIDVHVLYNSALTEEIIAAMGLKVNNSDLKLNPSTGKAARNQAEFERLPPEVSVEVPQGSQQGDIYISAKNANGKRAKVPGAIGYQVCYTKGAAFDPDNYIILNTYSDLRKTHIKFPIRRELISVSGRWIKTKGEVSRFGASATFILP